MHMSIVVCLHCAIPSMQQQKYVHEVPRNLYDNGLSRGMDFCIFLARL